MTLSQHSNLNTILITIYCFVDDFLKSVLNSIKFALRRPDQNTPPTPKHNLTLAELVSLAIFRFLTGHRNWKDFYQHIIPVKDFFSREHYLFWVLFFPFILYFGKMQLGNKFSFRQKGFSPDFFFAYYKAQIVNGISHGLH